MRGQEFRARKYGAKLIGRVIPQQGPGFRRAVQAQVQAEQFVKSMNLPAITQNYYMIFAKEVKKILEAHKGETAQDEVCIAFNRWYSRGMAEASLNRIVRHYGLQDCVPPVPPVPCEDWETQEECEAAGCYWWDDACHSEPAPPVCDWAWKRKLTFSGNVSATNLDDFPVLVHLTNANFDFNKARDNGEDIRFMDTDLCPSEGIPLKHEIELWDKAGENAWVWVKVPRIDGGSVVDFIYMYYGNPAAPDGQDVNNTWNANYMLVLHMKGNGTTTLPDSTSYGANGTKGAIGEPANLSAGKMNGAQRFDGTNDYVTVADNNFICPFNGPFTVEFWFTAHQIAAQRNMMSKGDIGGGANNLLINSGTGNDVRVLGSDTSGVWRFIIEWSNQIAADTWYHVMVARSGTVLKLYVNGVERASTNTALIVDSDDTPLHIGCALVGGARSAYHDGDMDEFRTMDTECSGDWVMAQFKSQDETLVTYGPEEGT